MRLVSKRARRSSFAPRGHGPPVPHADRVRQLLIEIGSTRNGRAQLVTRIAVRRQRRDFTFLVVTRKAPGVRQRPRLERAFL